MNDTAVAAAPRVLCVGDSITRHGFCPDTHDCPCRCGWVQRISEGWTGRPPRFVNAGVGGDTVVDVSHRIAAELEAHRPDLVVLMIGLNDTWRYARDASRIPPGAPDWVVPEHFATHYARVMDACRSHAAVVAVTPTLLGEDPAVFTTDPLNRRLEVLIGIVKRIAHAGGSLVVDARAAFVAAAGQGPRLTVDDGVHCTDSGQRLLARLVEPALRSGLETRQAAMRAGRAERTAVTPPPAI